MRLRKNEGPPALLPGIYTRWENTSIGSVRWLGAEVVSHRIEMAVPEAADLSCAAR